MRLVIIGADAAGMSAATAVRQRAADVEVVAFERGSFTSYAMCGLPMYVGAEFDDPQRLVARTPEEFARAGITVHTRTEVIAIDAERRTVRVRHLDRGEERTEPYDALLYATGASPVIPPLPGLERWGQVVHTLDDAVGLRRYLDERPDLDAVAVVGAGYIGMEITESLSRRGIAATLIDRADQAMFTLDRDMADILHDALRNLGADVRLGESLVEIREDESGQCREVRTEGGVYPAQLVVLALGARPNVDLARDAGCALGPTGALSVDDRMRTSVDGIWAAGDCVESPHLILNRPENIQLGTHANKQGKVAGLDIAARCNGAEGEARFPGVVGTAVTRICEWEVGRTGAAEWQAREAGLAFRAVRFEGTAKADYLPDPGVVHVKMVAEEQTGRVLGAQLVGTGNVAKRIDTAATWCQLGVRVQDAQLFDLAYAPPFGGVWDLLQVAARKLTRELGLTPVL